MLLLLFASLSTAVGLPLNCARQKPSGPPTGTQSTDTTLTYPCKHARAHADGQEHAPMGRDMLIFRNTSTAIEEYATLEMPAASVGAFFHSGVDWSRPDVEGRTILPSMWTVQVCLRLKGLHLL